MNLINFARVTSSFSSKTIVRLTSHNVIQRKKFKRLCTDKFPKCHPSKIIFNFLCFDLPYSEKSHLVKGLHFPSLPKQIKYVDCLVQYDLFYIQKLGVLSNENLGFEKLSLKTC